MSHITIEINSEETLKSFTHKVAPHTNMSPSKLNHAISKGYGCSHTSILLDSFKKPATASDDNKEAPVTMGDIVYAEIKDHDSIDDIQEAMDEVVFDHVGTSQHVSDNVNNAGLEAQINAVVSSVSMSPVYALLEEFNVDVKSIKEAVKNATPTNIGTHTSDQESIVLEITQASSVDDLSQEDYDKVEDSLISTVEEVLWDSAELGTAVDLLKANGLERLSSQLIQLARANSALDWTKQNL